MDISPARRRRHIVLAHLGELGPPADSEARASRIQTHFPPPAALGAGLSRDNPKLSRFDLTARTGEGLLLSELVDIQRKSLGTCTCDNRPTHVAY